MQHFECENGDFTYSNFIGNFIGDVAATPLAAWPFHTCAIVACSSVVSHLENVFSTSPRFRHFTLTNFIGEVSKIFAISHLAIFSETMQAILHFMLVNFIGEIAGNLDFWLGNLIRTFVGNLMLMRSQA